MSPRYHLNERELKVKYVTRRGTHSPRTGRVLGGHGSRGQHPVQTHRAALGNRGAHRGHLGTLLPGRSPGHPQMPSQ